jgi:hypothetical protein
MYVRDMPVQGALYQRLNTLVTANYAGLGPQNVASAAYKPMTGKAFQKPLSGATTNTTTVAGHPYR